MIRTNFQTFKWVITLIHTISNNLLERKAQLCPNPSAQTTTTTTTPTSVNSVTLQSYVFVSFQQITVKLDITGLKAKAFFPAV